MTFVVSLLAIFAVATTFIVVITGTQERESPPIFHLEPSSGKAETATIKNQGEKYAKSDRADLNLRECPDVGCKAIAVLRRGGTVLLTGKRQLVEGASGAAIPWIEVTSQSNYCIKFGTDKNLECIEWGSGGAYSGWVNALYIQEQ